METRPSDVRHRLLRAHELAAKHAALIRASPDLEAEVLHARLRAYILYRFMLNEEQMDSDEIMELARMSIARTLAIQSENVSDLDISNLCSGTSSVISKKVLLFMALQRDLQIRLLPEESASVKTIADLACLVHRKLN